jgi:two-component system NarL family response regulator
LRVFFVDDDPRMRDTIRATLESEPGFVVVGFASTAPEAIAMAPGTSPDVVIVDLGLDGEDGVDVIRALREKAPKSEIMAHTVFDDRDNVLRALKAGASSYLLKGCSPDELCSAVREVRAGGAPMSPRIARLVIRDLHDGAGPDPLSPRERQILRGIDQGLTYKELATELHISVHTVHSHIKSIYERLEARGKRDALARARARGLL